MKLEQGTQCWIPDVRYGWIGVKVNKVEYNTSSKKYHIELVNDNNSDESYIVETSDLSETNDKLPKLRNIDDTLDDLTTLSHLNEPSVLNSVKLRYSMKKIYTLSGVVLIAINPFDKMDELYSYDIIKSYQNASKFDNPPHVFSIADESFKSMKKTGESKSIIVSGESGAGKTVSAKYIMRFFATVHTEGTSSETTEIEKQILATNPIMESFGNAKTIRNDNSSRFGKYLKILFDDNFLICGAKIQTYLLERSRLVHQNINERNYHIFYQIIEGLNDDLKRKLSLTYVEDYKYLSNGGISSIKGVDDAKDFQTTCEALKIIGIDEDKQFQLFKILSGLLHIGNINIENSRGQAVLSIDEPNLFIACELLGLDHKEFCKWITKKKISTRSDNIATNLKFNEALVARDSISKYIYSRLFDWLVFYINNDLCSSEAEQKMKSFIGVLDIYGFEHFDNNSFEQFCINYANEKLQQDFTRHVFKLQQDDYIKEGIEWSFIKYSDNQPCIDLIEGKQGILELLDEQCKLPSGTDKAWAEKMFHSFNSPPHNKVFRKGKFGYEKFVVSHYALDVAYDVEGFLEKNRDTVSDAQNEVLTNSTNTFMKELLNSTEIQIDKNSNSATNNNNNNNNKRKSVGGRNKKPTLCHIFKLSLNDLMSTLSSTDAHYIRCIKPNETKTPWEFDNLMVLSQLRACGVLETIRISLVGFPSKYSFDEFLQRFVILLSSDNELRFKQGMITSFEEQKKLSIGILSSKVSDHNLFQVGKTKIFFRAGVLGELEIIKAKKITLAAIVIQKNIRRYFMRQKWLAARKSQISLQSLIRGLLVRNSMKKQRESTIFIQSAIRGSNYRKKFNEIRKSTVLLQSILRGRIARNEFAQLKQKLREEEESRLAEERRIKEEAEKLRLKHEADQRRIQKEKQDKIRKQVKEEEERKILEENILKQKQLEKEKKQQQEKEKEIEQLELAKEQQEAKEKEEAENALNIAEEQKKDNRLSNKSSSNSKPSDSSVSDLFTSDTDSNYKDEPLTEEQKEILDEINSKRREFHCTREDMLGMKPSKALAISTRYVVTRIKQIADILDNYEKTHSPVQSVQFSQQLTDEIVEDVETFKKMMRRCKYSKPSVDFRRQSVRSVNTISTEKIMFGGNSQGSGLDRTYKSAHADLVEYTHESRNAASLVAELLLTDIEPPKENHKNPAKIDEVLLPARYVVAIINDSWNENMVNQSAIFLKRIIELMTEKLKSLKDPDYIISVGCYLLNNLNEIRTSITSSRYNLMSDFDGSFFSRTSERNEYLKMLLIMKRYCETVFGQMYNYWINVILKEITKTAIDAIVLDDAMYNFSKNSKDIKHLYLKNTKYKIPDLIRIFSNVLLAMKSYSFDDVILSSVIHDMLTHIDLICFNDIMTRDGYFTPNKGSILKYNLSLINDWCRDNNISDVPNKLIHLYSLTYVLMQKKLKVPNKDIIEAFKKEFDPKVTRKILYECEINNKDNTTTIEHTIMNDNNKNNNDVDDEDENEDDDDDFDYTLPYSEDAFENAFLHSF